MELTPAGIASAARGTLAMLQAGESYQSPRFREAIAFLEDAPLKGTYAVATRALVWARLPEKFNANLEADARWLLQAFSRKAAGWTYEASPNSRVVDNSVTLFGAMALHAPSKQLSVNDKAPDDEGMTSKRARRAYIFRSSPMSE